VAAAVEMVKGGALVVLEGRAVAAMVRVARAARMVAYAEP